MRALMRGVPASSRSGLRTYIEPSGSQPLAEFDHARAQREHAAYAQALGRLGVNVEVLDPDAALPDCPFVEDTAVALPELCVLGRTSVPSRRAEVVEVAGRLARELPIARLRDPAYLEGGDVLRIGRTLYVGISQRTTQAGADALAELVLPHGYRVRSVAVHDALHLKTAATALTDDLLLINPSWCDASAFEDSLRLIEVDSAEPFAANTLRVGDTLLLSSSHPRTAARLEALGLSLCPLEMGEFERIEGGITCLSILWESRA